MVAEIATDPKQFSSRPERWGPPHLALGAPVTHLKRRLTPMIRRNSEMMPSEPPRRVDVPREGASGYGAPPVTIPVGGYDGSKPRTESVAVRCRALRQAG